MRISVARSIALARSEAGQSMAEYAMLVLVIAFVVLAGAAFFGSSLSSVFSSVAGAI